MICYLKGKTSDVRITCAELRPEARCLSEITRDTYRPVDSGLTKGSSKKI